MFWCTEKSITSWFCVYGEVKKGESPTETPRAAELTLTSVSLPPASSATKVEHLEMISPGTSIPSPNTDSHLPSINISFFLEDPS